MAMLNGLLRKRGGIRTNASIFGDLLYEELLSDSGVTYSEDGPDWPSQGSHARGLRFDGSTNYVDLGDSALYDDTAIAMSITVLAYIDASSQTASVNGVYGEGNTAGVGYLLLAARNTAGTVRVELKDDSNTLTILRDVSAVTDQAWNVITLVLDAAGTGWGMVVNGTEVQALGTAYTAAPATTTLNRSTIGALQRSSVSNYFDGPIAYVMRHAAALTLAQCRQVHEYIAAEVAGDGISLSIAGSESANSNSPANEWSMDEDASGAEPLDSAGSVDGIRVPGDGVPAWVGTQGNLTFAQATGSLQPDLTAINSTFGGKPSIDFDGSHVLKATIPSTAQPITILMAADPNHVGTPTKFIINNAASNRRTFTASNLLFHQWGGNASITNGQALYNASFTQIFVLNDTSSATYFDGVPAALSASPGTGGWTGDAVGICGIPGTPDVGSGVANIAEIVLLTGGAPTTSQLNAWLLRCKQRYGLDYTAIS